MVKKKWRTFLDEKKMRKKYGSHIIEKEICYKTFSLDSHINPKDKDKEHQRLQN